MVYVADKIVIAAVDPVVISVPAVIVAEFFVGTAMEIALATDTGFCFCYHTLGLMAVTDNANVAALIKTG